jgi:hypothetical protein
MVGSLTPAHAFASRQNPLAPTARFAEPATAKSGWKNFAASLK